MLSLRDLIVAENDAYIEDIMSERVISANAADDQEDVAQKMRDYDSLSDNTPANCLSSLTVNIT